PKRVKEDDDRCRKRAARNGAALKLLSVGMGGVAYFRLTGAAIFILLILSNCRMALGSDCAEVGGKLACDDMCEAHAAPRFGYEVDFLGTRLDLDCVSHFHLKKVSILGPTFCRGSVEGMDRIVQPWKNCFFSFRKNEIETSHQTTKQVKEVVKSSSVVPKEPGFLEEHRQLLEKLFEE
ncbi:unnamed protein product, partial [Notodromas monacha]